MKPLQAAADRDRLGETRPVVELQHRRSAALTSENIDILQRKLDSFFRRKDANPARIRSHCMIVKLHCISHFLSPPKHHAMTSLPSVVNQFTCGEYLVRFSARFAKC